jgi:hypothetical protein
MGIDTMPESWHSTSDGFLWPSDSAGLPPSGVASGTDLYGAHRYTICTNPWPTHVSRTISMS